MDWWTGGLVDWWTGGLVVVVASLGEKGRSLASVASGKPIFDYRSISELFPIDYFPSTPEQPGYSPMDAAEATPPSESVQYQSRAPRRRMHYHSKSHWSKQTGRVTQMLRGVRMTLKARHSYDLDGRCKLHIEDVVREASALLLTIGMHTASSSLLQHARVMLNELAFATRQEPAASGDPKPTSDKKIEWVRTGHTHYSTANGPTKEGLSRRERGRGPARRGAGLLLDLAEANRLLRVIDRRIHEVEGPAKGGSAHIPL